MSHNQSFFKQKLIIPIGLLLIVGLLITNKVTSNPSTFLWEVRLKSAPEKVAYLLGSIHIGSPEFYPLNSHIMNAWALSDILAVELNITDILSDFSNMGMDIILKLVNPFKKLSDQLPPELFARVKKHLLLGLDELDLNDLGLDESIIEMYTPLMVALQLQIGSIDPESIPLGIDIHFINLANQEQKPIIEVESFERQILALETINENIIQYIEGLLEEIEKDETSPDNDYQFMLQVWKKGDLKSMEKFINTPMSKDPQIDSQLKNALIFSRNIEMTAKIEELILLPETHFIVLGAGHFIGANSIIELLETSNKYNIKRW